MTDTEAFVALNMLPHIGPVRVRKLLAVFGSPQEILRARQKDLRSVQGIGDDIAESIASWKIHSDPVAELERARKFGAAIITQADSSYPALLGEIHNPPIVLYVWGTLRNCHAIGIVGTRKPSPLRRRVCGVRVPACLFGPHRRQRARKGHRHCGASDSARGKRQDDSRSRQRARFTLPC